MSDVTEIVSPDKKHSMMLLPPKPDVCQVCATKHEPDLPHNAQSLYYQMKYKMDTGKEPSWKTAMAHCTPAMKKVWTAELKAMGVDLDAGRINPEAKRGKKKV